MPAFNAPRFPLALFRRGRTLSLAVLAKGSEPAHPSFERDDLAFRFLAEVSSLAAGVAVVELFLPPQWPRRGER